MRFHQIRVAVPLCVTLAASVAMTGCGGSGGNGGPTALTGKPAMRAITISGYQTQVAATKYVLPLLVAAAPAGSPLAGLSAATPFLRSVRSLQTRALALDSQLNLYYSTSTSGASETVNFFTDAAGANSAGFLKVTIEGAPSFDTAYATYPAVVDISANVTAGNIIASGTGKITFASSSGANTLTGSINAPAKGIQASINMTLDPSGNVGGTLTVIQNGLTAVVTGLSGSMQSGFTGSASVTPGNLTGTATINLLQGTYSLVLNDTSGLSSNATVDANQNLTINYNDNTSLTLANTVTQPVTGDATNTGGGGTSSAYTIVPVNGNPWEITAVATGGEMVGAVGAFNSHNYVYWPSPTAAPLTITQDAALSGLQITGVDSAGHIVGSAYDSTTFQPYVLYWSAYNQTPVRLATPSPDLYPGLPGTVFIQSSGRIIATFGTQPSLANVTYVYSGPTDTSPYTVQGGYVTGASDGTAVLGVNSANAYAVWPVLSSTATPVALPVPATPSSKTEAIGADGTVIVDDLGTNTVWYIAGPSYTSKVALQLPAVTVNAFTAVGAIRPGPSGQVLGTLTTDNTSLDNEGLIWASATAIPVVLRTTDTPNVLTADFETSAGVLIVSCVDTPGVATYHYSVMTPK